MRGTEFFVINYSINLTREMKLNNYKTIPLNMKNVILLACFLVSVIAHSQSISPESVFAATGNLSNAHAQISWTLGDFQTQTYNKNGVILTQGFLQANLVITGVTDIKDNDLIDLRVFPNPVSDLLNLKFTATKKVSIMFYLYNLNGSLIYSKKADASNFSETVDFTLFESGVYILKAVSDDGSFAKTFKLFYEN
jgi:hypothetical protein